MNRVSRPSQTFLATLAAIVCLTSSIAFAQTPSFWSFDGGNVTSFPRGKVNTLGYNVNVSLSGHNVAETQRVEVEFISTGGPTVADRNLTVILSPRKDAHAPPQSAVEVELPLRVPENTTRMQFVRHVPKTSYGDGYSVQLLADGRPVTRPPNEVGASLQTNQVLGEAIQHELRWRVIWVNSDLDDDIRTESLQSLVRSHMAYEWDPSVLWGDMEGLEKKGNVDRPYTMIRSHDKEDLPHDWRGWLPFDAVVMHRDDFVRAKEQQPPWWNPLKQWIRCGGTVMLRGVTPETMDSAAEYTDASPLFEDTALDMAALDARESVRQEIGAMTTNTARQMAVPYQTSETLAAFQSTIDQIASYGKELNVQYDVPDALKVGTVGGMEVFPEGAGYIFQMAAQGEGEAFSPIDWRLVRKLLMWQSNRTMRRGTDPMLGSPRFFEWVIPGVSQPPVYTFMGLLGLFVILVGPIAYRKTTRSGRSYLMFLIAPILALATTAAMLGYGVISDGFGTRLRARQITWVGSDGDAMSRTRSTYFAGIRPSDGLRFPADAAVTLAIDNEDRSWEDRAEDRFETRGRVTVTDDAILFSSQFLPSRQQRQFIVEQPRVGFGVIRITEADEDKVKRVSVTIQNDCQVDLSDVLVRDDDGLFFLAEDVPRGGSVRAPLVASLDASKNLGEWYKREWLVSSKVNQRDNFSNNRARRRYNEQTRDLMSRLKSRLADNTAPTEGVFEFELQQRMQLGRSLPNGTYIAIADLSDDVPAIEGITIDDSIHFVMGELP